MSWYNGGSWGGLRADKAVPNIVANLKNALYERQNLVFGTNPNTPPTNAFEATKATVQDLRDDIEAEIARGFWIDPTTYVAFANIGEFLTYVGHPGGWIPLVFPDDRAQHTDLWRQLKDAISGLTHYKSVATSGSLDYTNEAENNKDADGNVVDHETHAESWDALAAGLISAPSSHSTGVSFNNGDGTQAVLPSLWSSGSIQVLPGQYIWESNWTIDMELEIAPPSVGSVHAVLVEYEMTAQEPGLLNGNASVTMTDGINDWPFSAATYDDVHEFEIPGASWPADNKLRIGVSGGHPTSGPWDEPGPGVFSFSMGVLVTRPTWIMDISGLVTYS